MTSGFGEMYYLLWTLAEGKALYSLPSPAAQHVKGDDWFAKATA
jgi:hypothetical protein